MASFYDVTEPTEMDLLVGFYDLTGDAQISRSAGPETVIALMTSYFDLTGKILQGAGGWLAKPIGDAGLAGSAAQEAEAGIVAFPGYFLSIFASELSRLVAAVLEFQPTTAPGTRELLDWMPVWLAEHRPREFEDRL